MRLLSNAGHTQRTELFKTFSQSNVTKYLQHFNHFSIPTLCHQSFNNISNIFQICQCSSGFVILGCFEIERSHLANESAGVCGFFYKKQILNNFWGWVCGVGKGI